MELECPICLEMIKIKNLEEEEQVMCPACESELELHRYGDTWELWEIEEE